MENPPITLRGHVEWFLDPWFFLCRVTTYLPLTIRTLHSNSDYATLLSPSRLREVWFANFWSTFGPDLAAAVRPMILPVLSGHFANGIGNDYPVYAPLSGRVLEIGAGSGLYAKTLVEAGATKVFGVEPNPEQIAALRARVEAEGIEDRYEGVPVGIEDLNVEGKWEGRIEEGSIDCIVTILCLCSIPEPEKNCKALWKLLKPGGRWFIYEHVQTHKSSGVGIRWYQKFVNIFWPRIVGGCDICRDTETVLREAGEWAVVDIVEQPEEPWCQVVPHIKGVLVK